MSLLKAPRFVFLALGLLALAGLRVHAVPAPGPNAFGYTALATSFSFENIAPTGTQVLANDDETFVSIPIGFTFNYYGAPQTLAFVAVNGFITFGSGVPAPNFNNSNLDTSPSQATIAVLWDDWWTAENFGDAVYYQTLGTAPNRRFIVQWNEIARFAGGAQRSRRRSRRSCSRAPTGSSSGTWTAWY